MYGRVGGSAEQASAVLMQALAERHRTLDRHCSAVSLLAEGTARELELSPKQIHEVRLTARLHDVGKVAVPDSILDKPGPLAEDESAFILTHTIVGERILAATPALEHVAAEVRSTHERWDGTGYPDQLSGAAIPLVARIVFAADAYDAMTTDRSYRRAIAPEAAVAELRRCAGTQLDPSVVAAVERTLSRRG